MKKHLWWGLVLLLASGFAGAQEQIRSVRMWPAPDNTRLVFDLSGPVEHSVFTLSNPDRLVLDIQDAAMAASLSGLSFDKGLLKDIRYASRGDNVLRVVLDLKAGVRPKSFLLRPQREYGHRLVVDLFDQGQTSTVAAPTPVVTPRETPKADEARDVIIAIDAGHGGDDPGALGRRGTREKDVVLKIAQRLRDLIQREPGMRPVMIRDGDYFVSLQDRVSKARHQQADLFISIHADAFRRPDAKGSSVFVLSEKGASSKVAQWLADSENDSDLIGGVNLEDKDDLLKMVLVDMVKNSAIEDSHKVASSVLRGLRGVNPLHKARVEQANFHVLKSTIPSILVETAFISNPTEEKKLRSEEHQRKLAQAILEGARQYFRSNPPPNTRLAMMKSRQHRISRGETLSAIAERYQVSVATLRQANPSASDVLHVGEILSIPVSDS